MRKISTLLIVLSISWSAGAEELYIDPVYQQTPVWCWAAVGEMVFTHYGVEVINPAGNFQCGIIALLHPICNQDCRNCIVPAGSLATMNNMLTQYPEVASRVTGTSTHITTRTRGSRLSLSEVQAEIDGGRPIVAGISPSGYQISNVSQHVALIVGYDDEDLIVNDPFPFDTNAFAGNPYEAAGGQEVARGQFQIPYAQFVTRLRWRESIYGIRCSGSSCSNSGDDDDDDYESDSDDDGDRDYGRGRVTTPPPVQYGRSCASRTGQCGPFYNQPAQPVGTQCWCATPWGPAAGVVVQP
jgi:hypothetical protein